MLSYSELRHPVPTYFFPKLCYPHPSPSPLHHPSSPTGTFLPTELLFAMLGDAVPRLSGVFCTPLVESREGVSGRGAPAGPGEAPPLLRSCCCCLARNVCSSSACSSASRTSVCGRGEGLELSVPHQRLREGGRVRAQRPAPASAGGGRVRA